MRGRVAMVTGAGRGIGLVTAERLVAAGARVVLTDIDGDRLESAAQTLRDRGIAVTARTCDVTDVDQVEDVVRQTRDEVGVVDLLVNNAGISRHRPPEELTAADFRRVVDVDLTGTFLVSTAVARHLIAAGRPGAIVNLSSIAGSTSLGRGIVAYGVAKAGVDQLTRELAVEWAGFGIRVNAVAPCQVRTEGFAAVAAAHSAADDQLTDRVRRAIPLGRLAEPIDVAEAIWFLASDAAAMITGVVLPVDGGNLAMNPGATLRSRAVTP